MLIHGHLNLKEKDLSKDKTRDEKIITTFDHYPIYKKYLEMY